MSATLTWYTDDIILCTLEGEFDVETYAVMEGKLPMMVREVDHPVSVILYLAAGAELPNLRGILQEIGILCNVMPPNFRLFVGVGHGFLLTNPLSLMIASIILNRYYKRNRGRVRVAGSIQKAVRLIDALSGDAG
ncbi:MAG: hypothetical protein CUN56_04135 [Phototrophicales bacterium]|nr:MAG: hypothetical protein CUN56_04135 [Phototrophicales bacterium]RMG76162.1 MAG: hypothetical protein D6711_04655 [Chloroflexota bacterium]